MEEKTRLSNRVAEYIINLNFGDFADLNVNSVARRFHVSVSHLSRTFKADRGLGLREYICREKILRSRILLDKKPRLRVKEIARTLGFCSCDYFIRKFKQHFGITPGRCRHINGIIK